MSDRKEYIEKNKLLDDIECIDISDCTDIDDIFIDVERMIDEQPAADVVEVVRCRDCKKRYVPAYCALWYGQINDEHGCRDIFLRAHNDDFYCAYGERKDGADNE